MSARRATTLLFIILLLPVVSAAPYVTLSINGQPVAGGSEVTLEEGESYQIIASGSEVDDVETYILGDDFEAEGLPAQGVYEADTTGRYAIDIIGYMDGEQVASSKSFLNVQRTGTEPETVITPVGLDEKEKEPDMQEAADADLRPAPPSAKNEFDAQECWQLHGQQRIGVYNMGGRQLHLGFTAEFPENHLDTELGEKDFMAFWSFRDPGIHIIAQEGYAGELERQVSGRITEQNSCRILQELASQELQEVLDGLDPLTGASTELEGSCAEKLEATTDLRGSARIGALRQVANECQGEPEWVTAKQRVFYHSNQPAGELLPEAEQFFEQTKREFPGEAHRAAATVVGVAADAGECSVVIEYWDIIERDYSGRGEFFTTEGMVNECRRFIKGSQHCVQQQVSGSPRTKIDLVYVFDGEWSEQELAEEADHITRVFLGNDDIVQYTDKFNVWVVQEPLRGVCKEQDDCDCNFTKVSQATAYCPSDAIVLVSRAEFRSCGSPQMVMASKDKTWYGTSAQPFYAMIPHELGHTVFGLADEYWEEGYGDRPTAPNCFDTESEAEQYWTQVLGLSRDDYGFYDGCSYTADNVRGTRCTIMGGPLYCMLGIRLPTSFGPINEAHIARVMGAIA